MASPFPASLPPLPQIPNRFTLPTGWLHSNTDVGPGQRRLVTTANVEPWSFPYVLHNEVQKTTFRTFVNTTLSFGSLPFTTTYNGVARDVWFESMPEFEEVGHEQYRVMMSLWVLP